MSFIRARIAAIFAEHRAKAKAPRAKKAAAKSLPKSTPQIAEQAIQKPADVKMALRYAGLRVSAAVESVPNEGYRAHLASSALAIISTAGQLARASHLVELVVHGGVSLAELREEMARCEGITARVKSAAARIRGDGAVLLFDPAQLAEEYIAAGLDVAEVETKLAALSAAPTFRQHSYENCFGDGTAAACSAKADQRARAPRGSADARLQQLLDRRPQASGGYRVDEDDGAPAPAHGDHGWGRAVAKVNALPRDAVATRVAYPPGFPTSPRRDDESENS